MYKWGEYMPIDYYTNTFWEIYKFFVIESPVKNVSVRGISFEKRKIKGNYVNRLTNKIKEKLPEFYDNWDVDIIENLMDRYAAIGAFDGTECNGEFALHYIRDGLSKTTSLYFFIRCALAHGCFNIVSNGENYYIFENMHDETSKGRAVIKESTLRTLMSVVTELTDELSSS